MANTLPCQGRDCGFEARYLLVGCRANQLATQCDPDDMPNRCDRGHAQASAEIHIRKESRPTVRMCGPRITLIRISPVSLAVGRLVLSQETFRFEPGTGY